MSRHPGRIRRWVAAGLAAAATLLGLAGPASADVLPGDRAEVVPAWGAPGLEPVFGRVVRPVVAAAATPSGGGVWLAAADGSVAPFGDARWHPPVLGSPGGEPVVDLAPTASGQGYWLVDRAGGVYPHGDAAAWPGRGLRTPAQPVTAVVPTVTGGGYWVVAWDGSATAHGDATLPPSTSGTPPAGVVDLAPTPTGQGFWLVSLDGRVFPYGDAGWFGALDAAAWGAPVVAATASPSGSGYALALADGRVAGFGDLAPFGVEAACGARPTVDLAWRPGGGYLRARVLPDWPGPAATAGLHPLDQVAAESAQMDALLDVAQACRTGVPAGGLVAPVGAAPVTSGFGLRTHPIYGRPQLHSGVDFGRPAGYPVRAAADGLVLAVSMRAGFGRTVVLDHGAGLGTVYAHLSSVNVEVGQRVGRGAVLGGVGSTGFATGPHLHFEVRVDGTPTDPLVWL